MPFPVNAVVGDLFKFIGRASINGQIGEVACHCLCVGVVGASVSTAEIAQGFAQTCDLSLPPQLPMEATVEEPLVEKINQISGRVVESAFGISAHPVGTAGGNAVPTQVSVVVKKVTGLAGQRYRGRIFWPFVFTSAIDANGKLTLIAAAGYEAATGTLFNPFSIVLGPRSADFVPILMHAVTATNPLPLSYQLVLGFSASLLLGTQRRRGDYGQLNRP
jgi:hypothetical protein